MVQVVLLVSQDFCQLAVNLYEIDCSGLLVFLGPVQGVVK